MSCSVRADDKLILDLNSGALITTVNDLVMEGTGEVAFKADWTYVVNSVHPYGLPPFVRVTDEQMQSHVLDGANLRQYFKLGGGGKNDVGRNFAPQPRSSDERVSEFVEDWNRMSPEQRNGPTGRAIHEGIRGILGTER